MKRSSLMVLMLTLLGLSGVGCIEDIVKDFIDVPVADVFVDPRLDFGVGDSDVRPNAALSLAAVKPNHGPFIGGNTLVINGTGFGKDIDVRFGDKQVDQTNLVLLSPVSMEVVVPAGEVGLATIDVTRGGSSATLTDAYTYDPLHLDPNSGPTSGGTLITLETRELPLEGDVELFLGGRPCLDVRLVSQSRLQARTPEGEQGPATLALKIAGTELRVEEAFTYTLGTNQLTGGLAGESIDGTLTVAVLNRMNRMPIPGAHVVLQRGRELQLQGDANSQGVVVFQHDDLRGPVTVTAAAEQHETMTLVSFDAAEATLFLTPIIPPTPGSMPPGQYVPLIEGHVLFGGATGAGVAQWNLIPAAKEGEVKRVYVFTTNATIRHGEPRPTDLGTIDFNAADGLTAWPFTLYTRFGNLAVYAVAGLYNQNTETFRAYALGITRGVVAGPGDRLRVDIIVDMPLADALTVELRDAPPGLERHGVRVALDLGADGYLLLPGHDRRGEGVPPTLLFGRLPRTTHPSLVDATFAVDVVLESRNETGLPLAQATETLIPTTERALLIDRFVGLPQQVSPQAGARLLGNTLRWSVGAGERPDLAVTALETSDQTPVWTVISPGHITEVKLPDPETLGLPGWPEGPLIWLQWLARIDEYDFNQFNYRDLGSTRWTRWSFDLFSLSIESR
ncbi:MAG: IPT/TIG domain-containing protein [Deltaproteobacteria bacterium]|nr:IPT/TIG domain-containing protein [Deltaproteobacteria bacterium]